MEFFSFFSYEFGDVREKGQATQAEKFSDIAEFVREKGNKYLVSLQL